MKKLLPIIIILLVFANPLRSQVNFYASGGPEIIFSVAEIEDPIRNGYNILRFAPVLNIQVNGNIDFGKHFGLTFGAAIRNVGFIYDFNDTAAESNTAIRKKYRNYVFGMPVGFKVGLMNSWLFYGGSYDPPKGNKSNKPNNRTQASGWATHLPKE